MHFTEIETRRLMRWLVLRDREMGASETPLGAGGKSRGHDGLSIAEVAGRPQTVREVRDERVVSIATRRPVMIRY